MDFHRYRLVPIGMDALISTYLEGSYFPVKFLTQPYSLIIRGPSIITSMGSNDTLGNKYILVTFFMLIMLSSPPWVYWRSWGGGGGGDR